MIRTVLEIDGMMCGMCESHVNDAVRRSFSVKSVKSNRHKRECVVVSEEPLDEERLRAVVTETGYDLRSIRFEPYQKRRFFGRR